jgi:hypothetical protein
VRNYYIPDTTLEWTEVPKNIQPIDTIIAGISKCTTENGRGKGYQIRGEIAIFS